MIQYRINIIHVFYLTETNSSQVQITLFALISTFLIEKLRIKK